MAATILVTASNKAEEQKKAKAFQYMDNNLTVQEIERLEQMARSAKARAMLNENWSLLQSMI